MTNEQLVSLFRKWWSKMGWDVRDIDHIDVDEYCSCHVYYKEPVKTPVGQLLYDSVYGYCDNGEFLAYPQ